ncbi:unnamed protein product [Laminaria digitata]
MKAGVRVTMHGVSRQWRNVILPVLLGAHVGRRRLASPKPSLLWSLCWGLNGIKSSPSLRKKYTAILDVGVMATVCVHVLDIDTPGILRNYILAWKYRVGAVEGANVT